uniref:Uncharacterized protein n=1 Tax=Nelumbo nucifera TaxID=4432 RepID=A0A822XL73_NELNU|nr:TPA_asm: hypothetical protein HUJ06_021364 [Nelumbo nucifera]
MSFFTAQRSAGVSKFKRFLLFAGGRVGANVYSSWGAGRSLWVNPITSIKPSESQVNDGLDLAASLRKPMASYSPYVPLNSVWQRLQGIKNPLQTTNGLFTRLKSSPRPDFSG